MAHKQTCFDWIATTFVNCSSALALAIVLLFGIISDVRAACKIEQIAELKIEQVAGAPMLDGQVNGEHIRMLLDTGSNVSFLTLTAARQMKLLVHRYGDLGVYGQSGYADLEGTRVKELRIGDITLRDHSINVAGRSFPTATERPASCSAPIFFHISRPSLILHTASYASFARMNASSISLLIGRQSSRKLIW
jgi:hypothetical protein